MSDEQQATQPTQAEQTTQSNASAQFDPVQQQKVNEIIDRRVGEVKAQKDETIQQLQERLNRLEASQGQSNSGHTPYQEPSAAQKQNMSADDYRQYVREEFERIEQEKAQEQEQQAQQERNQRMQQKANELKQQYTDFDEVLDGNKNPEISQLSKSGGMARLAQNSPEDVPEIAYYLAKNPEKLREINQKQDAYEQYAELKLLKKTQQQLQNNGQKQSDKSYTPMETPGADTTQASTGGGPWEYYQARFRKKK